MLRFIFTQHLILQISAKTALRWGNREEKRLADNTVCCAVFYACLEVFRSEKTNNNEGALMATIDSMNRDTTRLSDGPDWTFELLETYGRSGPGR